MKVRFLACLIALLVLSAAGAVSAQQTGEIYGKVIDASGAVLPGVSVTLSSPVLLQPLTAITSETGTYRFPAIPIGVYSVKFELEGFKSVVNEGIRIEIGLNAQINQALEISSLEETILVEASSPLVDLKDAGKNTRFTQEQLQAIPSSRDPWTIIEQSAGVAMDRQNVGGSASGQQSNFVARGAAMSQQKWILDGVDITDMSATGGSPVYFDFDAFEEMQISTGGADVTMQSAGVGVNLVTKSGTDQLRGSSRYYVTDDSFQSVNVDDTLRKQGATTGNPIQNIKDYGIEAGGPIKKGRAWIWGSYGKQNVNVGINNFYKADAACQAMKAALAADPTAVPVEDTWGCLNSDTTILNNYNLKFSMQTVKNNQFSWYFNAAEKVRNARDASDLRPLETTYRQIGVDRPDLGSSWWKTGMPKSYKWTDRHIFNDRFLVEGSYAHVGNNFALTFHEDALRDVQPSQEINSGLWGRSYTESVYVRPTDSFDVVSNYFLPGTMGGDHAVKFGFKWRGDIAHSEGHWGGNAIARFRGTAASEARIYRDSLTEYGLHNRNFYVQDTFTRGRVALIAGLRFDYQTDYANGASVGAAPFYGQATYAGVYSGTAYTGAAFNQLPAITFNGADAGVAFKNWSPRVGFTYDLAGDGRTVMKMNYARYVGQLGTGDMSSTYNTVVATYVQYPWIDVNNDQFVQTNEIVLTSVPLAWSTGYNYNNPSSTTTSGKVDPNLSSDTTDEIIVDFDRQIGTSFAVSASYIWRNYGNFRANDTNNFDANNWTAVQWTPTGCTGTADCPAVTYYQPTSVIPTDYIYTNVSGYSRTYQGVEIAARKRFTNRWQMNASYSYNNTPVHFDSPAVYVFGNAGGVFSAANANSDPTNIENSLNGGQYAPESTSSGLGNVFVNAKWIGRLSGLYLLPLWDINLAGFYNTRDGYPYVRWVTSPNRPNGAGTATVYLDKRGDVRLPNFQTIDFRVDKTFKFANRFKVTAGMDIFNLLNGNTTLSQRGAQNGAGANNISSLLAPRVFRFGVRATW